MIQTIFNLKNWVSYSSLNKVWFLLYLFLTKFAYNF